MSKIISKVISISVRVKPERCMENAINQARDLAYHQFGIDDCGHSDCVDEWERSNSDIIIQFDKLQISGHQVTVYFNTWCEKYEEDD